MEGRSSGLPSENCQYRPKLRVLNLRAIHVLSFRTACLLRPLSRIGKHGVIATTVAGRLSKSFRNRQFPVTPFDTSTWFGKRKATSEADSTGSGNMLTISEMAKAWGVSINTIGHWRQKGLIRAHAINGRSQFLFEGPGRNPPKKHVRKIGKTVA